MSLIARRAAAAGAMTAFLAVFGAVTGVGITSAGAATTSSDGLTVRLTLSPEEGGLAQTDKAFRVTTCADDALATQWSGAGLSVAESDCQLNLYLCAAGDWSPADGFQVVFTREGASCVL